MICLWIWKWSKIVSTDVYSMRLSCVSVLVVHHLYRVFRDVGFFASLALCPFCSWLRALYALHTYVWECDEWILRNKQFSHMNYGSFCSIYTHYNVFCIHSDGCFLDMSICFLLSRFFVCMLSSFFLFCFFLFIFCKFLFILYVSCIGCRAFVKNIPCRIKTLFYARTLIARIYFVYFAPLLKWIYAEIH